MSKELPVSLGPGVVDVQERKHIDTMIEAVLLHQLSIFSVEHVLLERTKVVNVRERYNWEKATWDGKEGMEVENGKYRKREEREW